MSARFRFLWTTFSRIIVNRKVLSIARAETVKRCNVTIPCAAGFSIFTWLGFEKKLSAEDELIQTIKHCVLFIQRQQYERAEQLLHIALRQAQQINHHLGIIYIYDVMANLALERLQLDQAKKLFIEVTQRIMADGANEDDIRVVHLSCKLARVSQLQKEYTTAQLGYDWCIEKLNKLLSSDPTEESKKLLAMTEDWYGRLFLDCNQYEQGLNLLVRALNRMKEVSDIEEEHLVVQLNDIGTVCDKLGKYDESIEYISQAIDIGKKLKMDDIGTMYVNLGRVYIKKNLLEEARKNCGHAWKLGVLANNKEVKEEAELCIRELKELSYNRKEI